MAISNTNKDNLPLDDELITRLMEGKLSEEEEAAIMSQMETADNEMLADTIEGLGQYTSLNKAQKQAFDINRQLLDQLKSKPDKQRKQLLPMNNIIWAALIFIIILVLIAYYLIRIKGL